MKSILRFAFLGMTLLFVLQAPAAFGQASACGNISSGSVAFNPGSCAILPAAAQTLAHLAEEMRADPACRVIVVGNSGGNKPLQQLSWARVSSVIEQMSEFNNIDRNRFVFDHNGVAPANSITFEATSPDDDRPSSLPQPAPGEAPCK